MAIHSFWKSALLFTALASFVACNSEESKETADTETECECSSPSDNYCNDANNAMDCTDGCHFAELYCDVADCASGCDEGECWVVEGCCGESEPDCFSFDDNYCEGVSTLMSCVVCDNDCDNYFEEIDCTNPEACPGGSGCALNDAGIAACWCCQLDAGEEDPDAGADAGD